jgi:biotin carboxyl carrier protein
VKFVARHEGTETPVSVERYRQGYRVTVGEETIVVDLSDAGPHLRSLRLEDGSQFSLTHHREGNLHEMTLAGSKVVVEIIDPLSLRRKSRADSGGGSGGIVKALMPGRIVSVMVAPGNGVQKGSALLILEAMKMQNEIQAPVAGAVDKVFVQLGDTVEAGAPLVQITASIE